MRKLEDKRVMRGKWRAEARRWLSEMAAVQWWAWENKATDRQLETGEAKVKSAEYRRISIRLKRGTL